MNFLGVDVTAWNIQDIATIYSSLNTAFFPNQFLLHCAPPSEKPTSKMNESQLTKLALASYWDLLGLGDEIWWITNAIDGGLLYIHKQLVVDGKWLCCFYRLNAGSTGANSP